MHEHEKPVAAAFAAKLKELRTAAGLTMVALGKLCDPPMHAPAVARYEAGRRPPTWEAVVRLSRALGVTPDVFAPPPEPPRKPRRKGGPA